MKYNRISQFLSLLIIQTLMVSLTWAAPMDGEVITFTQPEGTVVQLQVFGDEFYAETRTVDGYTVVFDPSQKAYFYAVLSADKNELESSGILVGTGVPPAGLPKKLTIRKEKGEVPAAG